MDDTNQYLIKNRLTHTGITGIIYLLI